MTGHPAACICSGCVAPPKQPGEKRCPRAEWCVCKPGHAGECLSLTRLCARVGVEAYRWLRGRSNVRTS